MQMTEGVRKSLLGWCGIAALLGLFAGLCTVFALVVTLAEGWQEHARAQWPEVMARVDRCRLHETSTGRREKYYIHCPLSYAVGAEQIVVNIYSGNAPSPKPGNTHSTRSGRSKSGSASIHQGRRWRCVTIPGTPGKPFWWRQTCHARDHEHQTT